MVAGRGPGAGERCRGHVSGCPGKSTPNGPAAAAAGWIRRAPGPTLGRLAPAGKHSGAGAVWPAAARPAPGQRPSRVESAAPPPHLEIPRRRARSAAVPGRRRSRDGSASRRAEFRTARHRHGRRAAAVQLHRHAGGRRTTVVQLHRHAGGRRRPGGQARFLRVEGNPWQRPTRDRLSQAARHAAISPARCGPPTVAGSSGAAWCPATTGFPVPPDRCSRTNEAGRLRTGAPLDCGTFLGARCAARGRPDSCGAAAQRSGKFGLPAAGWRRGPADGSDQSGDRRGDPATLSSATPDPRSAPQASARRRRQCAYCALGTFPPTPGAALLIPQ